MNLTTVNEGLSIAACVLLVVFVVIPNMARFVAALDANASKYSSEVSRAADASFSLLGAVIGLLTIALLIHFNITVFPG